MNWIDDKGNLEEYAVVALTTGQLMEPRCCNDPDVHVYAHSREKKHTSVWVWCSKCGSYAHMDIGQISDKWKNCDEIDFDQLTAVPVYQESKKDVIDRHFSEFLGK